MTNDPLMNQCRKEAEERYPKPLSTAEAMRDSWNEHIAKFEREAYAAALYRERSKPKREGLSDEALIALLRRCSDDALLRIEGQVYPNKGIMDLLVEDFALGLRTAHYAPPGTLTVEQAVSCVKHWVAAESNTKTNDPEWKEALWLEAEARLREALTAKAR